MAPNLNTLILFKKFMFLSTKYILSRISIYITKSTPKDMELVRPPRLPTRQCPQISYFSSMMASQIHVCQKSISILHVILLYPTVLCCTHSVTALYSTVLTSLYCTVLTALYSLYCTHCTVLTALYSLHCTHCTLLTALYSLYCTHCTVLTVLCSLHCNVLCSLHCTVLYSLQCTVLYSLQCTVLYSQHCTVLYSLQCTVLYSLHCTVLTALYCTHCTVLYSLHCTPLSMNCLESQWHNQFCTVLISVWHSLEDLYSVLYFPPEIYRSDNLGQYNITLVKMSISAY